ncbi:MAG: rhodanese-related sulfurtransferase [Pyrinomonadaceae bacterium]
MPETNIQIITFYQFKRLENLSEIKTILKSAMDEFSALGTIIIAGEGFNATVAGLPPDIEKFVEILETIFETELIYKSSFHTERPFLKAKVRIKNEIVSLRRMVKIERGIGTHAKSADWNEIISDENTIILDARNDYEIEAGTFKGAINPNIEKFSDLPKFIEENFSSEKHRRIAMFCTGGIRCEKFAPFLKEKGFENVYQLEGGILKYLEETPETESLWEGECFVFDDRIAVDKTLRRGKTEDARPLSVNPPQKKI